jgi:hypothetical protein
MIRPSCGSSGFLAAEDVVTKDVKNFTFLLASDILPPTPVKKVISKPLQESLSTLYTESGRELIFGLGVWTVWRGCAGRDMLQSSAVMMNRFFMIGMISNLIISKAKKQILAFKAKLFIFFNLL